MKAFRCDSCGVYFDDQPSKVVRVLFGPSSIEPDVCEDCQIKIAKLFPKIKIRDKITKEEL